MVSKLSRPANPLSLRLLKLRLASCFGLRGSKEHDHCHPEIHILCLGLFSIQRTARLGIDDEHFQL